MFLNVSLFAVLVLFLHQGHALKCYECNDYPGHGPASSCSGKMDSMKPIDCFASSITTKGKMGPFACATMLQKEGNKIMVGKGCDLPSEIERINSLYCKNPNECQVHSCDTDGCNRLPVLAPEAVLVLLMSALVTLLAR